MNIHSQPRRKPVNVSLDENLVADAKAMGVNLSRACESGLAAELRAIRESQWIDENREAIESSNAWVAKNGLPLAKYRRF